MSRIKSEVKIEDVIRKNEDGMPMLRYCMPHETLLSFLSDSGNEAFKKWWEEEGYESFHTYYESFMMIRNINYDSKQRNRR